MATFPYTYANLKASINARLHNKLGLVATPRTIINDVVSEVSNLQLRSAKKSAVLAPNFFNDIYQYAAPPDLDGNNIIGIQPQNMDRNRNQIWELVSEEEFDIRKQSEHNLIAVADHSFVRSLRISAQLDNVKELSIAAIQGLTGDSSNNSSWTAFGNSSNLSTDLYNFIKGSGSLQFDLTAGGTTAGVVLTTVNAFDLTYYKSAASVFTWAYLTTASNITNIKLRLGNSASIYYEMTATAASDGGAFVNGWNLVRFDFNSKTTTGSPTDTTCNYAALFFTKASGTADTGYRFNWLNAKQGSISNIIYYRTNPWQTAAGAGISASTVDTDQLVCDQDEYNLFIEKGVEILGLAAREYDDSKLASQKFGSVILKQGMAYEYKMKYPTESIQLTSSYYYLGGNGVNSNSNSKYRL